MSSIYKNPEIQNKCWNSGVHKPECQCNKLVSCANPLLHDANVCECGAYTMEQLKYLSSLPYHRRKKILRY